MEGSPLPKNRDERSVDAGEQILLEAEFARSVLEAAPTIIYVYDLVRDRRIFQSRQMHELLGHASKSDGRGEWNEFIHPDDVAQLRKHRAALNVLADGETASWEFRMRDAGGDWRWFLGRAVLLQRDAGGKPRLIVGCASDVTEQKRAEEFKDVILEEMRHRARNLSAVIEALGRQSRPKDKPEVGAQFDNFIGRLRTLLNAGDLILSSRTRKADLQAVAETALEPFTLPQVAQRISVEGPPVTLTEQAAGGLALAIHELATNATKYGALSGPAGTVSLRWRVNAGDGANVVAIEWKEQGGPAVDVASAEGFGSKLIRYSVSREAGSAVHIDLKPDGVTCRIEFQTG